MEKRVTKNRDIWWVFSNFLLKIENGYIIIKLAVSREGGEKHEKIS